MDSLSFDHVMTIRQGDDSVTLYRCELCEAVVAEGGCQGHADWHSTLLHAPAR